MRKLTKIVRLFVVLFVPACKWRLLRFLGDEVDKCKIGLSVVWVDRLRMEKGSSIGHGNVILVPSIEMEEKAKIKYGNILKGNFFVEMRRSSVISRFHNIVSNLQEETSRFQLGENSALTKKCSVDLTSSVIIGKNTQFAGVGIQIWTHGYVHYTGGKRLRIQAPVVFGDDCYVGSASVISPGVKVCDGCNFSSMVNIVGTYDEPGLYVGAKAVLKKALNWEKELVGYKRLNYVDEVRYSKI